MNPTPPPRKNTEPQVDLSDSSTTRRQTSPEIELLEEQCPEAMEYVSQLIARMNGFRSLPARTEVPSAAQPRPEASSSPTAALRQEPGRAPAPSSIAEGAISRTAPADLQVPRAVRAVEKSADLRRLREAANLTALSDLQAHETRSRIRKSCTDLAMAMVSMATSVILVSLSERAFSVAYGCALLTFLQAVWSTRNFLARTDSLRRGRDPHSTLGVPEV